MIRQAKNVILLVNLGSPQELSVGAIRQFLARFLSDKRVVNLPKCLWYPILYGIILPFRSRKLLAQYRKLWELDNNKQSPLLYYTQQIAKNLQQKANDLCSNNYVIAHAFSYSNPLVEDALAAIHTEYNVQELLVIPLYPQFSSTTTSAVFDQVVKFYHDKKYLPKFKFNRTFVKNDMYINAICNTIHNSWQKNGKRGKMLVFSYHGLPQAIIDAGDLYYEECLETTKLIITKLGLSTDEYTICFQSRFGANKWLVPATIDVLSKVAKQQNITDVDVICPGFVCDCLETLEEISVVNKKVFLDNGGVYFNYIPCLNDSMEFAHALLDIVEKL